MQQNDFSYCEYLSCAYSAIAAGDFEEALKFYDCAINSSDAMASVYYLKCELLFILGRREEAVEMMTRYGHEQDNVTYTYYLTSKHFEYRAKMDEAAFWWEKYQDRIYGRENLEGDSRKKHLTLFNGEKK